MFEQVSVEAPPSRLRAIGRALPRVGLAVFFALVGYSKFDSDPGGEWVQIFEQIGVGQWLRYLTGIMQVGGAILLLSRRTLSVGAAMLACTMGGAAFVDLFIMTSPIVIAAPAVDDHHRDVAHRVAGSAPACLTAPRISSRS